jgi:RNA polymerase sigma-70 factor (ECF subfamily)
MVEISPVPEISDDEALERAIQGDPESFSILYERYVTRIYNYIFYRTGSPYDAEDLTERVFLRALGHIKTYNNRGVPFTAWLYRIAHNLVANWHRDNSRRKEVPLEDQKNLHLRSDHPETALVNSQDQAQLLQIIRGLSEERQQLIILKFVEHMSNAEVATIMGRSEGAIKSLYHRTLQSLREEMDKHK